MSKLSRAIPRMTAEYAFRSNSLARVYEAFRADPERFDVMKELALLRSCLAATVAKIPPEVQLEQMPAEFIACVMQLTKAVTDCCEAMARIERLRNSKLDVEQVMMILDGLARVATRHVPPEKHEELLEEMMAVGVTPSDPLERNRFTRLFASSPQEYREIKENLVAEANAVAS